MPSHHFTVDVEEYFQVSALEPYCAAGTWDELESRVEIGTDRLLALLESAGTSATFFVLGWIAERRAALVRRIADAGHEVASHGTRHELVTKMSRTAFRECVRRSRAVLEDAVGQPVVGYRAPSFSVMPGMEWALDTLIEEGYEYDSSLFPVSRQGSGYPGGPRRPVWLERANGRLLEVPPATVEVMGRLFPAGGGAYLRLLPLALCRSGLRQADRAGYSGTFYVHPWELDPDQPRMRVNLRTRVRHYGGLRRTEPRLETLLREFRFQPIRSTLSRMKGESAAATVSA